MTNFLNMFQVSNLIIFCNPKTKVGCHVVLNPRLKTVSFVKLKLLIILF